MKPSEVSDGMTMSRARRSAMNAAALVSSRLPTYHVTTYRLGIASAVKAYASPRPAACSAGVTRDCFFFTKDQTSSFSIRESERSRAMVLWRLCAAVPSRSVNRRIVFRSTPVMRSAARSLLPSTKAASTRRRFSSGSTFATGPLPLPRRGRTLRVATGAR
ncbi:hypothetical protein WME75_01380 [Sorangium sp. So ce1014]|uniref:hypothetical protein n=1 Tax=Sorangium sp. So ce1014 TaxID=3133326 RepID=UPI003F624698